MEERGATEHEVIQTVEDGERFEAKFGRAGFRRNFDFGKKWRSEEYKTKQVEAYCSNEKNEWLVITVITKYF